MPGIGDFLGQMFSGLAGGQDGTHVKIWQELKPWFGTLAPAAARKWLPQIAAGALCEVPVVRRGVKEGDCERFGVAACDVCHRPTCLEHGRIDMHGDIICYICVADATQVVPPLQRERARQQNEPPRQPGQHRYRARPEPHAPPPPGSAPPPRSKVDPRLVAAAMKKLGLKPGATWEDVKRAHRKRSAENHPDNKRGAKAKAEAEARFKEVQAAFDLLKMVMGQ
jgi:hypothetical protein